MSTEIQSPLPPEQCIKRIQETSDREGFFEVPGDKPVIAKIKGDRRVRLRKRRSYGHAFAPKLYCWIEEQEKGAAVYCKSKIPILPKIFATLWMGFILLFFVVTMGHLIHDFFEGGVDLGLIGVTGVMTFLLIGGTWLIWSGQRIGKREIPKLKNYLRDTLQKEEKTSNADLAGQADGTAEEEAKLFSQLKFIFCLVGIAGSLSVHALELVATVSPTVRTITLVVALPTFIRTLLTVNREAEKIGILKWSELHQELVGQWPMWAISGFGIASAYFSLLLGLVWLGVVGVGGKMVMSVGAAVFFAYTALTIRSWNELVRGEL